MNDAVAEGFSGEFSVCDCDRYAEHLADISVRRRMVIASDDVRNQFGVLLLARGAPLGRFAFGRMRGHRLNRPVDEALAMRRCLDNGALASRLRELLDCAPDLQHIAVAAGLAPRLEALCETAALGPALLQKLSVLEEVLPAVFHRALFCACFGVLLAGERRLDAAEARLLFHEHVAHGQGSGENVARRFSNVEGSYQTSLGLYRTAETYQGGNGYSLRMDGLDPGFNDAARRRAIVMHGAWYADPDLIRARGRLGRSQGCPALREGIARVVIDAMKQRQLLFAYADDAAWLQRGRSFACDGRDARTILAAARGDAAQGGGAIGAISAP